jgi:hypothetical protein
MATPARIDQMTDEQIERQAFTAIVRHPALVAGCKTLVNAMPNLRSAEQ